MRVYTIFLPVHQPVTSLGATPAAFPARVVREFEAFVRGCTVFFVRSHADEMLGFDPTTQHAPALRRYEFEASVNVAGEIICRAMKDFVGGRGLTCVSRGEVKCMTKDHAEDMVLGVDPWDE